MKPKIKITEDPSRRRWTRQFTRPKGVVATIEPLDDCCYRLSITRNGKEEHSGVWCPVSTILAMNGQTAGWADTAKEVLRKLEPYRVTQWGLD